MNDLAEEVAALLPRDVMVPVELKLNSLLFLVDLMAFGTIRKHYSPAMVAGGADVVVALEAAKLAQQGPSLERE